MNEKHSALVFLALLTLCVLLFSFFYLTEEKRAFSPNENRALQTRPVFRAEKLLSGKYASDWHDYLSDQLPFRDAFIKFHAACELTLGKKESNRVIVAKDTLIDRLEYNDTSILEENLRAIDAYRTRVGVPVTVGIAPRTIDVRTDALPALFSTARAERPWTTIRNILPDALFLDAPLRRAAASGEYVAYRTDHHWTAEGAYLAYVALADALGYTPLPREDFSLTAVAPFRGTSAARAGIDVFSDTLVLPLPAWAENIRTTILDTGESFSSFYDFSYLETADKYSVFFGGNPARVLVSRTDGKTRKRLMILKDSFANALAPYLAAHFDLILVDPRYDDTSSSAATAALAPDRVLVLMNPDTLARVPLPNLR